MVSLLKIIIKAIIWLIFSFLLLFAILVILIRIPAIQSKLSNAAISFISNKTHTRVELKTISISFPKSVVIKGLFLEDTKKDTLLFAGEAKINIRFKDLLRKVIHVRSFSLNEVNLNLHNTAGDSLFNYDFLIKAFSDTSGQKKITPKTASKWTFSIDKVTLNATRIYFDDEFNGLNASLDLKRLALQTDRIDFEKLFFAVDEMVIEKMKAKFSMKKPAETTGKLAILADINILKINKASIDLQSELKVSAKVIYLEGNKLTYQVPGKPVPANTFDPNNLQFSNVKLSAKDLEYSAAATQVSLKEFSATNPDNFTISKFETDFKMDKQSIIAKNLSVKTTHSVIDADLSIHFSSLKSLADSMNFNNLNAVLKNASISNADVTYFVPVLGNQDFFKDGLNVTTVSGTINGSIDKLTGKDLVIKTGGNSVLSTDFTISGLPDIKNSHFSFPDIKIVTGRKDIQMIAGQSLPKSLELPENLVLRVKFDGRIQEFTSTLNLQSSYGTAQLSAKLEANENFKSKVSIPDFNLGLLLKDTAMLGKISLTAELDGHGLDVKTVTANIRVEASEIFLNRYDYHNLSLNGNITGLGYEGKISLNDENIVFDYDGKVNFNPGQEQFKFLMNVKGADLQKLNFTRDDFRIGFLAEADLKGGSADDINGKLGITNIIMVHEGKKYLLDSLLVELINRAGKSNLNITSDLITLNYAGNASPAILPGAAGQFLGKYFPFSESGLAKSNRKMPSFSLEIRLHNNPVLMEALLPQLSEFEPGLIQASYDADKSEFRLNAGIKKLVYGTTEINDFEASVDAGPAALNYRISALGVSNSRFKLDNLLIDGKIADKIIFANLSSIDEKNNKKLLIRSRVMKNDSNYRFILDPEELFLMNNRWNIAADNYIEFGKKGLLIHHFFMNKDATQINVSSVNDQFQGDLDLEIKNFKLDDISRIIEKDTSLIKGTVDGKVLLKRMNKNFGIIADAKIRELVVRDIPVGNITVRAGNPTGEKFDLSVQLEGADNKMEAVGYYIPNGGANSLQIKAVIQSLSMKTLEAFSMGEISETSGSLSGSLLVQGTTGSPELTGELVFRDVFVKPAFLNSRLELKNETIQLKKDGIYFKSFTMLDADRHTAIIDGTIFMQQFRNLTFDFQVNTLDFLLFNTTAKDNTNFNGRMVIDSKIDIKGPMALPIVNAKLKIKKGSNFTFAVPENKLSTDRGEGVVEFTDTLVLNPILGRAEKKVALASGFKGVDLNSIIEVDKQATLRLLMDPASTDSLVVRGEAALSFALDRSGKMTLTGAYNLNEGSYLVSLESVIKRKFEIVPGSTIIWNGDPLDAEVSINATYSVRASPFDLVADQMSVLSAADKGGFKNRYPFLVFLKLRGEILHPQISFEIQLPPAEKGILGGVVNQRLIMLNEDASALNKQVFALLVLGRFIQENPLQTESGGTSGLVRSTVGKFLSAQLNQLSSKVMPGVELNFDIQSYDDYQSGQAQGRTQVEIGLKKQLFNERLSVQVGGTIDVEGEKARQNTASSITSDVTVEYKLAKDGSYRLKAFRQNQYEGAIEGQLVETGVGIMYLLDFNNWKEFITRGKSKTIKPKKEKLP